jgi:hypothetical protein
LRIPFLAATLVMMLAAPMAGSASAEPYQDYLARLRTICSVECLQTKQFQRTARKRNAESQGEMAIIMDVADVQRVGDRFELYNLDTQASPLEEVEILGSAGIDTSSRSGIGALPRGRQTTRHPNVIVVEIDRETLFDLLNIVAPSGQISGDRNRETGIVVEGERDQEFIEPNLSELRSFFRNRRIVARGSPRLEVATVGARRDFRRKQVTLELSDARNLAMLPRFDENGEPILAE